MATQAEKDHYRARVAACDRCDQQGWRLDHGGRDGDRPLKCDHHGLVTHEPILYALTDDGADPEARDCDLLAEVPLPPGVDSAGPWSTDQAGHLLRDLSDGRLQHGDGEAVAACRLCAARDDDDEGGDRPAAVDVIPTEGVGPKSATAHDCSEARHPREVRA